MQSCAGRRALALAGSRRQHCCLGGHASALSAPHSQVSKLPLRRQLSGTIELASLALRGNGFLQIFALWQAWRVRGDTASSQPDATRNTMTTATGTIRWVCVDITTSAATS